MIKKMLCWFLLAFVVVSCDESYVTPDPEARGLNYYPLQVGNYRVYDVTDIEYQNNVPTEKHFQMREWVADSFLDQTNALTYKIIRSVRPDAQSEWLDDSVMTVTKDDKMVILTKDNTKYIKLVFPVTEGRTWEADAYNDHYDYQGDREKHVYSNVGKPSVVNDVEFDKTASITILPPVAKPATDFYDRKEIYAYGVGKIYRLFHRLSFESCDPVDCSGDDNYILDGHKRTEILIDYGKL
ncbi:hypothetical protein [Pontibacter fetidus]|uniref:Uncharacterized protein n=1 Tax=Pontibacter fetidus TaxID=2700082 RepID=A0A6B2H1Z1_9BACT|nr:hypothetical protein [Pontibacter fetidus]NDK54347.1 hypothetical protein [Pontibacter fetidus]